MMRIHQVLIILGFFLSFDIAQSAIFKQRYCNNVFINFLTPGDNLESFNIDLETDYIKKFFNKKLDIVPLKGELMYTRPHLALVRKPQVAKAIFNTVLGQERTLGDFRGETLELLMKPDEKYNIVLTDNRLSLMKIGKNLPSYFASKHYVQSYASTRVWFAGEIWLGSDGLVHVNGCSGTFRPSDEDTQNAVEFIKTVLETEKVKLEPFVEY